MLDVLDINAIILIAIVAIVLLIAVCFFTKLIRLAVGLLILLMFPILYNIFWGDGMDYVKNFADVLSPQYSQEIQEVYQYYKDRENQVMSIEEDTFSQILSNHLNSAQ